MLVDFLTYFTWKIFPLIKSEVEKQYTLEVRVWVKSRIAQIQILVPPLLAYDEKELPDPSEPHFLNCKKAVNNTTSSQGHKIN